MKVRRFLGPLARLEEMACLVLLAHLASRVREEQEVTQDEMGNQVSLVSEEILA